MPRPKGVDLTPHSDEEEARIQAGIAADPDTFEWTDEDFARARPAHEVMSPELLAALKNARYRGPQKAPTKAQIAIRLDRDLLDRLRASGPGWQGRVNDILRAALMG
jgi:uncharacterized protein (DUF4415 family)